MQIRKGGSWRTITSAQAYINGAWRQLTHGKHYKNLIWREVVNFTTTPTPPSPPPPPPPSPPPPPPPPSPPPPPTLGLSITPSSFNLIQNSAAISKQLTATPSGGKSPYRYQWSITQSDGPMTLTNPTSATVTVTTNGLPEGATWRVTVKCVCTDSTGLTGQASASGGFEHDEPSPGGVDLPPGGSGGIP